METTTQYRTATVQLNSLADLDQVVSQQFNLPLRPYSTDIRTSLELVVQANDRFKALLSSDKKSN
ncbi:hypothetical protein [Chlorogloeopsis sp. ULAP02]|uniref:hypothetical protein n=1 Tax=Chlorogloeopsis sp. ULAP02 TaxID=3107926 RepID=UPI0031365EC6